MSAYRAETFGKYWRFGTYRSCCCLGPGPLSGALLVGQRRTTLQSWRLTGLLRLGSAFFAPARCLLPCLHPPSLVERKKGGLFHTANPSPSFRGHSY